MKSILLFLLFSVAAQADAMGTLRKSAVAVVHHGSGVVTIAPSGHKYVLTNWHVCTGLPDVGAVQLRTFTQAPVLGRIVKSSPEVDLCALDVPQSLPGVQVAQELGVNDRLYTVGWPNLMVHESTGDLVDITTIDLDMGDILAQNSMPCFKGWEHLPGTKICKHKYETGITTLYSDHGASGSGIVNDYGQLVGIMQTWMSSEINAGGIVLRHTVVEFLKGL